MTSTGIDFSKLKDGIIDAGTDLVSKIIKDKTDGAVTIQSIVNGQIKVDANEYIDKAVSLLNNQLESNNLDTSELPDVSVDFEHNIACGIIIPGTANIQDGSINVICFGPQIKIMGTLTDISLDIDLVVERNLVVTVNKFNVSSDGDLKLEFQNLENFDHLSEKISEELKTSIKKTVLGYLEKSVKERIDTILSSLPLVK
ncbi:uncharacterized protein LOC119072507 isoform X2 [Bradysia coprophila]|uniref:uncharacterized protein LOC119072507 isoform X2 n=1 Tax=Bradysia coprophila TaxID=38358 RepID=UPI00187DD7D7|nr:uncharacterized protein LOC119072507 isoform X2 [Bradysia coprophila]